MNMDGEWTGIEDDMKEPADLRDPELELYAIRLSYLTPFINKWMWEAGALDM
jgi:hypothetical protein